MNACNQWQEKILDHALGSTASPDLHAHLALCEVCSVALETAKFHVSRLDAGIRQAMAAHPPVDLAARILSRASSEQGKPAFTWSWRAAVAGLACAAALIATVHYRDISVRRERGLLATAAMIGQWRSPTAALLRSPSQEWFATVPHLGETFFQVNRPKSLTREEKQIR